jgi:FkbM family methyltransferase
MGVQERVVAFLPRALKLWVKRRIGCPDVRLTLEDLRRSGFSPATVIDVGAYDATWSRDVARIWPAASFILFEPSPAMAARCRAFCGSRHAFFDCAVSDYSGASEFTVDGTNSRLTPARGGLRVRVVTLDGALGDHRLAPPALLKIDVQGEDLRVVNGAADHVLPRVSVIVIELSLIKLAPEAPGLVDAIARLDRAGFRLADICTFWRRAVDHALWQVDAVFVRRELSYGDVALGY